MNINHELREEENDLKKIYNMFKKRKFKGDSGQVVKNSSYQLATNLIFKFGSLLFTLVLARLLQPERMGLYNLALSTIVIFTVFSDLGIGNALTTFTSKLLSKSNKEKARGYYNKLLKYKQRFIFYSSIILLLGAYFISEYYFQKPIFLAILAGAIYIPFTQLVNFLQNLFRAENNFKVVMRKEIIFQILRIIVVPVTVFFLIQLNISDKILIMFVILMLSICYLISLFFLYFQAKKNSIIINSSAQKLNHEESLELKKFILPLSFTALAGTFFGNIDTLMLGKFVSSEFLAYYGAAFALIASAGVIIGFMTTAMMPLFSRENGSKLERMFKKTTLAVSLISILAMIFTYLTSWWIIRIAYGTGYLQAVPILRWFSIMLILTPLIGIYTSYFISQKRTKVVGFLLVGSTILNILFNLFAIKYGINNFGQIGGVYGAMFATILSRIIYLSAFIFYKRKYK